MTRLSNGFSRKRANLRAALERSFRLLQLLSDAQEHPHDSGDAAGITRKPWTMADLLREATGSSHLPLVQDTSQARLGLPT
jgi:hypothetical protein